MLSTIPHSVLAAGWIPFAITILVLDCVVTSFMKQYFKHSNFKIDKLER